MSHGREAIQNLHVLVVRGSGVLLIGGYVELMASLDGNVLITNGVSGTDLRSFLNSGQICNAAVRTIWNSRCQEQWRRDVRFARPRLAGRGQ